MKVGQSEMDRDKRINMPRGLKKMTPHLHKRLRTGSEGWKLLENYSLDILLIAGAGTI